MRSNRDALRSYSRHNRGLPVGLIVGGFVALIILIAVLSKAFGSATTEHVGPVLISGKERVTSGSGDTFKSEYRVYYFTPDGQSNTMKVTDSIINAGRTRSADLYGSLIEGSCYDVTVYGVRIGLLSAFPNLKSATLVQCPAGLQDEQKLVRGES